ncbi:hypothetical protein ACWFRJ_33985 [Streptomyces sp. NPDC055239]
MKDIDAIAVLQDLVRRRQKGTVQVRTTGVAVQIRVFVPQVLPETTERLVRLHGLDGVVYCPQPPYTPFETDTANFLSGVGLPGNRLFKARADVGLDEDDDSVLLHRDVESFAFCLTELRTLQDAWKNGDDRDAVATRFRDAVNAFDQLPLDHGESEWSVMLEEFESDMW